MSYIKRLFTFFQQSAKCFLQHFAIQRLNALENSPLGKLPTELLQQVVDYLTTAPAVSLSLSCRHIYLLIGAQYLENLATSGHETLVFLELLEHDLQNQIVCHPCRKLHRIQDARKYAERVSHIISRVERPHCLDDDSRALVTGYIHENFSSTVFKMAMKHHYHFGYDAQSRKLLKLLSEEYRSFDHGTVTKERKAECQIKNGSLFAYKNMTFQAKCTGIVRDSISYWICPHFEIKTEQARSLCITSSRGVPHEEKWSLSLSCVNNNNTEKISWDVSLELQKCQYCETEYKIYLKHDDGCTIRFTITIWKDLGEGPETRKWKAHVTDYGLQRLRERLRLLRESFERTKRAREAN